MEDKFPVSANFKECTNHCKTTGGLGSLQTASQTMFIHYKSRIVQVHHEVQDLWSKGPMSLHLSGFLSGSWLEGLGRYCWMYGSKTTKSSAGFKLWSVATCHQLASIFGPFTKMIPEIKVPFCEDFSDPKPSIRWAKGLSLKNYIDQSRCL